MFLRCSLKEGEEMWNILKRNEQRRNNSQIWDLLCLFQWFLATKGPPAWKAEGFWCACLSLQSNGVCVGGGGNRQICTNKCSRWTFPQCNIKRKISSGHRVPYPLFGKIEGWQPTPLSKLFLKFYCGAKSRSGKPLTRLLSHLLFGATITSLTRLLTGSCCFLLEVRKLWLILLTEKEMSSC